MTYFNKDVRHITHQFYKLDGTGFFDEGRDQLVWVTPDGQMDLLTSGLHNYAEPRFSPKGNALYALRHNYDPEGARPSDTFVDRWSWPTRDAHTLDLPVWALSGLAVAPDGGALAFYASQPDRDHGYGLTSLYRWDLSEARLSDLSIHLDQWAGDQSMTDVPGSGAARPAFDGDRIWALLSERGRVMAAAFSHHDVERLNDKPRVVYDFAGAPGLMCLALADPIHPSGIALVDNHGRERIVWAPTPCDEEDGPVAPEEFWATEVDGTRVHTWCLKPRQGTNHPVILEVHGGPMGM